MYRRGGVIVCDNFPVYTVFLSHVENDFDFCRRFLADKLGGKNIEHVLDDDNTYKKSHFYEEMDLTLQKIPPAVTVYMSTEGFFEVSHGLFITCKKSSEVVFKTLKQQKAEKSARGDFVDKMKKKNKYLASSESEEEPDSKKPKNL